MYENLLSISGNLRWVNTDGFTWWMLFLFNYAGIELQVKLGETSEFLIDLSILKECQLRYIFYLYEWILYVSTRIIQWPYRRCKKNTVSYHLKPDIWSYVNAYICAHIRLSIWGYSQSHSISVAESCFNRSSRTLCRRNNSFASDFLSVNVISNT